jgi:hypothetical protein
MQIMNYVLPFLYIIENSLCIVCVLLVIIYKYECRHFYIVFLQEIKLISTAVPGDIITIVISVS